MYLKIPVNLSQAKALSFSPGNRITTLVDSLISVLYLLISINSPNNKETSHPNSSVKHKGELKKGKADFSGAVHTYKHYTGQCL